MKNLSKLEILQKVETGEMSPVEAFEKIKKLSAAQAAGREEVAQQKISLNEIVKTKLIDGISEILSIPASKINPEHNIKEYGFDSISFTGYSNYISEHLKLELAPNVFFDNDTVTALCDYICNEFESALMETFGTVDTETRNKKEDIEVEADNDKSCEESFQSESDLQRLYLIESSNQFPLNFWEQDMKQLEQECSYSIIGTEEFLKDRHKYVHLLVEVSNHKKMEVLSSGKGQTLIIMGGVGMAAPLAMKQIEYFSKQYRVLYIHNPGCGLSEDLTEYSLEARVTVVLDILNGLGIQEPVYFVGISWGGLIGQKMSAMYPDKVSALILISSIYKIEEEKKGVTADEAMRQEILATSDDSSYITLLEKGTCINNEVFVKYMEYYLPGSDKTYSTYDAISDIGSSVLVIYGEEDSIVSTTQSETILERVKNGVPYIVKNAGHFNFLTHHEEVNKQIEVFLNQIEDVHATMSLKPYVRDIVAMQKKWEKELSIKGIEQYKGFEDTLNTLCASYAYEYFIKCDVDVTVGKIYDIEKLCSKLNILPAYKKLYLCMIQMLIEDKIIRKIDTKIQFIKDSASIEPSSGLYQTCIEQYSEFEGMVEFLNYCVSNYKEALCGKILPISVLFPKGSSEELEKSNQNTVEYGKERIYAMMVHDLILELAKRKQGKLRILEVGGGTGLLTRQVADAVHNVDAEYYFTDIGEYFIQKAQKEPLFEGFHFQAYDISKAPEQQGLERGSFDLVLGINVVHATANIADTVQKLKTLLTRDGSVMIIEASKSYRWVDMVWGLTEGWWYFEDSELRQTSPIINIYDWERVFEKAGFRFVKAYPDEAKKRFDTNCSFIIGQQ